MTLFFLCSVILTLTILLSIISSKEVKEYLKDYFDRSEALVGGEDRNLYLLCIQCFEVSTQ